MISVNSLLPAATAAERMILRSMMPDGMRVPNLFDKVQPYRDRQ